MNSTKKYIIIISIILLIGLIVTYSNHFNNGFHFDDMHTIVENVHIRSLKNIPQFFTDKNMFSVNPYNKHLRSIVTSTLAIDYWLGDGLDPFYFHLSTFIFFIILGVLMYFVFKKIISKSINHHWAPYISIVAVGWYMLHTANAETINYVISRSDVLSTFFIVLSFAIYLLFPTRRKYYLYIIPAILGIFTKETVPVLPLLLFTYILFFEKKLSVVDIFKTDNFKEILNVIFRLLPLILTIIIFQSYTLYKTGSVEGLSNSFTEYIQTQPYIWLHYFITFFLPFNLSADTDWTVIKNIFDDRIIIGFTFIAFLIYVIIKTSKKQQTKPIAFGFLWFIFSLLPTSIAPLAEVMNDHRMFFPFIGLTLSVVYFITLILMKFEMEIKKNVKYTYGLWICIFLLLTSYAYGTYNRNKVWKNGETLWYDVTVKSPNNGRGLMNYGLTQMSKGNYEEAEKYFKKALVLTPNYSLLYINLGILQEVRGRFEEAEESFLKAISFQPTNDRCYFYYAKFLFNTKKDIESAKTNAKKALEISPDNIQIRYLLMKIYQNDEAWNELTKLASETLKFLPNDETSLNFLDISKNKKSKIDLALQDINNQPTAEKYLNLSLLYYNEKMYDKCIEACYAAIELKPDFSLAYNNICSSHNALGNFEEAVKACEKSLSIDSSNQLTKNNLNYARKQLNLNR